MKPLGYQTPRTGHYTRYLHQQRHTPIHDIGSHLDAWFTYYTGVYKLDNRSTNGGSGQDVESTWVDHQSTQEMWHWYWIYPRDMVALSSTSALIQASTP